MSSASTTAVPAVPTAPSRVWLDHYPPGVPATIDVDAYASVRDVFEESCRRYPTRPAFTCMGRTLTFADLDVLSARFGAWLQSAGAKRGTRLPLMMPNILQ
jgi:long-chain acyl-CoA synthetase